MLEPLPLILVVEDEPEMASFIADVLKETGRYDAVTALSAKEASKILDKNKRFLGLAKNRVGCIVLDIKMPEKDGLQFLEEYRRTEPLTKLMPVIILSAYEDSEKWMMATSPGIGMVVGYLKKPVNKEQLIDTLDRVFHDEIGHMIDETRERKYRPRPGLLGAKRKE